MQAVIDERSVYNPHEAELQLEWACAVKPHDKGSRSTLEPISLIQMQIANAGILYLSPILQQLYGLQKGPETDDYGRLQPTEHAFGEAIDLLVNAAIDAYPRQIPSGCVSTDSEGGVRIEWVRETSSVHLVVPATNSSESYVYHEVDNSYATEDATPEGLSNWLKLIADGP